MMKVVKQTTITYKPQRSVYIICDGRAKLDSLKNISKTTVKASLANSTKLYNFVTKVAQDELNSHKQVGDHVVSFIRSEISELESILKGNIEKAKSVVVLEPFPEKLDPVSAINPSSDEQ